MIMMGTIMSSTSVNIQAYTRAMMSASNIPTVVSTRVARRVPVAYRGVVTQGLGGRGHDSPLVLVRRPVQVLLLGYQRSCALNQTNPLLV